MQSHCRGCNILIHTRHLFSPHCSWNDAIVATISDASFCEEQEQLDGITQNFKSQEACITAQALGNALNAEKMLIHPLSWGSTRNRRVCRSTLMVEAHALSYAVGHGLRTRATIVDMRGQLNTRQWEEKASAAMGHVWFADLTNTKQVDNKRLAIDLSALKQLIWENRDDCDEEVDGSKGDYLRWIDTSAMLSDSSTTVFSHLSSHRVAPICTLHTQPTAAQVHLEFGYQVDRNNFRFLCCTADSQLSCACMNC